MSSWSSRPLAQLQVELRQQMGTFFGPSQIRTQNHKKEVTAQVDFPGAAASSGGMASSSRRRNAASRGPSRLVPPSSCSTDADASDDTKFNAVDAPESLLGRLEAVDRDAARRKFALYGRQNAHVDHISGTELDMTIVLQSTMLLQEDGLLAARLDDVTYLLDGLLPPATTRRVRLAQTRSVLELMQLLQDPQTLQAVELSSQRRRIQARVRELLLTSLGSGAEEETHQVALAELVYFLSGSPDAQGYIDEKVLDVIVLALKRELAREGGEMWKETAEVVETDVVVGAVSRKKTCLRRKQTSCKRPLTKAMGAAAVLEGEVNDAAFAFEMEHAINDVVKRSQVMTSTTPVSDEYCLAQIKRLLVDHSQFYVDGKIQISTAIMLCASLHNLLKVEGFSSSSPSSLSQQCQQQQSAGSEDTAGATFKLIQLRKRQLVQNGGVDALVHSLSKTLNTLEASMPTEPADPVSPTCALSLHRTGMLLCVFDQATFLALDVQQYISKRRTVFALLLKFIRLLSGLCWGRQAQKRWESDSNMSLAVDVLLSTMRVLINLTHHNIEAARHMNALGGMQLLATAFSLLWVRLDSSTQFSKLAVSEDKWEFDSCLLLLSVIVNSIEFSDDNRDSLAGASLFANASDGKKSLIEQTRVSSCELFTQFFQAKVESYVHLMDKTETQDSSRISSIAEENDDWNPEDVILGGCTSLLLGYLMKGSAANSTVILQALPDNSPQLLLRALGVFVAFHSQIGALTPEVAKSVLQVEEVLKSSMCAGRILADIETKDDQQHATMAEAAPNSKGAECDIDRMCTASVKDADTAIEAYSRKQSPHYRTRPLKNVCANIDDSDSEPQMEMTLNEKKRPTPQDCGIPTPTRTPPRSPRRKRSRVKSPIKTAASPARTKSPVRRNKSTPAAVLSDGSISSPVVAQLLRRTRQLVDEFDAEFSMINRSTLKKSEIGNTSVKPSSEGSSSPMMVLTMDVSCRDNGRDGLDLSQDIGDENYSSPNANQVSAGCDVGLHLQSNRRKKLSRDTAVNVKGDKDLAACEATVFDFALTSTPPATPLRKITKNNTVMRTPTRSHRTPGLCRQ
ncbi:unnamed protein product [Phytophthora lilii]|uniref:Unnamed protein product n=1 Tax=Phytophthora lilii TaxID=2077276 RepID=A0A9W6WQP2_9STRA|nr:unnamed protein product [Phytophthora lilii]